MRANAIKWDTLPVREIPEIRPGTWTMEKNNPETLQPLTSKDTNPKDAVGSRKARWFSYIPLRVLYGVGLAMLEGARKYGRHNYRIAGIRASVYVDAAVCGHLTPFMEGQDIDPESGLHHIDKAIASLVVLRDGILAGNWVDDRPPAVPEWDAFMKKQHANAVEIIERIPNAREPYTQVSIDSQSSPTAA